MSRVRIAPAQVRLIALVELHGSVPAAAAEMRITARAAEAMVDEIRDATGLRSMPQIIGWFFRNGHLPFAAVEEEKAREEREREPRSKQADK